MEIPKINRIGNGKVNSVSISIRKRVKFLKEKDTQKIKSVNYIYGLKNLSVAQRVQFYRVAMMRSEQKFLWMSKTLQGFPVSEEQILKNPDNGDMVNLVKTGNMKRHRVDNGVLRTDPGTPTLEKGSINSLINNVYVSPDCSDVILSVPRLLSAGINVLFLVPDIKKQGIGSVLFD